GLSVSHTLDLSPLKLEPGASLDIWATGQDVYERDGKRHDVVKSLVRKITIIDPASMAARIAQELSRVRQQAVRLEGSQESLTQNASKLSTAQQQSQQAQLSQRINSQEQAVDQLKQRMERNRLNDPDLAKLLDQSADHL